MDTAGWNKLFFMDSVADYDAARNTDHVVHILCIKGSVSFYFQHVHYNIAPGDYVILTNVALASGFSASDDYRAIAMALSESFVTSMTIRSNYGIIGHFALMQNPVMKLSDSDFKKCLADMERLKERVCDTSHLFYEEMIGHLLTAHILDLYDIHMRSHAWLQVSEHTSRLLWQFVELLYKEEYVRHRDVSYYASRLCVTPHYLSELCKKASGKPVTYWIDRFTLHKITRLLCQKELTLSEISEQMNFSSVSYFSRYVKKQIGVWPTEYRNSL